MQERRNPFGLLRPHQIEPARRLVEILNEHGSAVDFSEMGVGKTAHACAVVAALDPINALVVCPKVAITAWQRMLELFGTSASVLGYEKLRTGRTPFGHWQRNEKKSVRFVCQCCQRDIDERGAPCP